MDTIKLIIRKDKWKFLSNDERLDELYETIIDLQDYLDNHIPNLTKRITIIEQRVKVLEKSQDRLFKLIRYSKT